MEEERENFGQSNKNIVVALLVGLLIFVFAAWIVMVLWNYLAPRFNFPKLDMYSSAALLILFKIFIH